ncbi:hypothetical protein GCM10010249_34470 [Streptomyces roseolilacinus]|uniref:Uncharacterized protein n=1 Tax=Streptomyces roseolilacinus TaxID=66904 RepID=A0A918B0Y0_9ACTN|nr:hypothetical protein GCM10010249_34470 [Streptomyces roseolilacinus]
MDDCFASFSSASPAARSASCPRARAVGGDPGPVGPAAGRGRPGRVPPDGGGPTGTPVPGVPGLPGLSGLPGLLVGETAVWPPGAPRRRAGAGVRGRAGAAVCGRRAAGGGRVRSGPPGEPASGLRMLMDR